MDRASDNITVRLCCNREVYYYVARHFSVHLGGGRWRGAALIVLKVTFQLSSITLKKPQMPPPVLMSAETRGSSCSSGKVIGDPVTNPPVMAGC